MKQRFSLCKDQIFFSTDVSNRQYWNRENINELDLKYEHKQKNQGTNDQVIKRAACIITEIENQATKDPATTNHFSQGIVCILKNERF